MYWSSSVVVVGAVKEYIPVKQGLKRSCKMANKINY